MNRTAICIKMLLLLRARNRVISTRELADELETNPRNIREYRTQLVLAGYNIMEKKGRHGGYYLDDKDLFPALDLSDKENQALLESRQLMRTHSEFGLQKEFESALDKISSGAKNFENEKRYLYPSALPLDKKEQEFIDLASNMIKEGRILKICYQSLKATEPEIYQIDPYEILHYHNAYYLVAYSHKSNEYRTYRFSKERMKSLEATDLHFNRSLDFRLDDMIGKHTVFKDELTHFVVKVSRQGQALFLERAWGNRLTKLESKDGWDTYSFYSEEEMMVRQQLFALGDRITVIEPKRFANDYVQYLQNILKNYGKD